jgi:quercetin dioxygenase-like cupin family protein
MKTTDVASLALEAHHPQILSSGDAARVVAIALPAGEELQTHEVHEHAWVVVTQGAVEIEAGGTTESGGPGLVSEFEPKEPHRVVATEDARILLFLAPWPGDGHPGAMSLDDKEHARERAQERAG